MYVPQHFAETDPEKLYAAMEQFSFAILVSTHGGKVLASHLPLLLDRTSGNHGMLLGHMARANLQWDQANGGEVLAIFSGPHAYISPQWYAAPRMVPTWNYVAVHAYGRFQILEEEAEVLAQLRRTVATYESPRPQPWQLDAPPEFLTRLAQQIVGFRIPIERLEGKWKLSQNHPVERRQRIVSGLLATGRSDEVDIANLILAICSPQDGEEP